MKTGLGWFAASCCLVMATYAWGEEPEGEKEPEQATWLENHADAGKAARDSGKLIVTDLFTDWCGWCKKLENETYPAPKVQEVLKKFVLLKINPEKDPFGKMLMAKAGVTGFPATVITDSGWDVIKMISGYLDADRYSTELNAVLEGWEKYKALKARVSEGGAGYDVLYDFLKAAYEFNRKDDVKEWGPRALEMEKGPHHAEIAFWIAMDYGPDSEEFGKYMDKVLGYDPENTNGYYDDLVIASANSVLSKIRTMEEMKEKIAAAREILEKRLAQEKPPLNPEKGQLIYGRLADLYFMKGKGDVEKTKELIKKAIELAPDTDLAGRMSKFLENLEKEK